MFTCPGSNTRDDGGWHISCTDPPTPAPTPYVDSQNVETWKQVAIAAGIGGFLTIVGLCLVCKPWQREGEMKAKTVLSPEQSASVRRRRLAAQRMSGYAGGGDALARLDEHRKLSPREQTKKMLQFQRAFVDNQVDMYEEEQKWSSGSPRSPSRTVGALRENAYQQPAGAVGGQRQQEIAYML